MLLHVHHRLFENFGINAETCQVTVRATRLGDAVTVTTEPAVSDYYRRQIAAFLTQRALPYLRESVAYVATGDIQGVESFAYTAGGETIDSAKEDRLVDLFSGILDYCVSRLKTAVDLLRMEVPLEEWITAASAASFRWAVAERRADLLAPGMRATACVCGRCGLDIADAPVLGDRIGVGTPSGLSCGNPFFNPIATAVQGAIADLLPAIELPQLRRLKLELAEEGLDLTVTLPDGDAGEPWPGTILHADPPSSSTRESRDSPDGEAFVMHGVEIRVLEIRPGTDLRAVLAQLFGG